MYHFWKGMNAFRLSEFGMVFRIAEAVGDDYYKWILPEEENLLGYIVDQKVFVLLNAGHDKSEFKGINLPEGNWKLIATKEKVDHFNGIEKDKYKSIEGGKTINIKVEPESLRIWVKE